MFVSAMTADHETADHMTAYQKSPSRIYGWTHNVACRIIDFHHASYIRLTISGE